MWWHYPIWARQTPQKWNMHMHTSQKCPIHITTNRIPYWPPIYCLIEFEVPTLAMSGTLMVWTSRPHEDWYNKRHPFTYPHPNIQVLVHLNLDILKYSPQTCFPTYLTRTKPKIIMILCVHQFKSPCTILILAKRFSRSHNTPNYIAPPTKSQPTGCTHQGPHIQEMKTHPTPSYHYKYHALPTLLYIQPRLKYPTIHTYCTNCFTNPMFCQGNKGTTYLGIYPPDINTQQTYKLHGRQSILYTKATTTSWTLLLAQPPWQITHTNHNLKTTQHT